MVAVTRLSLELSKILRAIALSSLSTSEKRLLRSITVFLLSSLRVTLERAFLTTGGSSTGLTVTAKVSSTV